MKEVAVITTVDTKSQTSSYFVHPLKSDRNDSFDLSAMVVILDSNPINVKLFKWFAALF